MRDFIQSNYEAYDGDESFLVGPTERTNHLWEVLSKMFEVEREQGLCVKPCLLQLYEDKLLLATLVDDGRGEVYAEHRDIVTVGVGILMRTHLHTHHLTLQKCGDKGARYPLVLNKIFEDGIIYGVRDVYSHG